MMSKKALIVIDIQNDYFENGALELVNPLAASVNAQKMIEFFRKNNLPIVFVQHLSADPDSQIFIPGTFGAQIHEQVKPMAQEKLVQKYYPNSFRETDLLDFLKSNAATEVVITGMMTHMCVDSTTRAAKDLGFECTVIADACATKALEIDGKTVKADEVHHAFLSALSFFYAKVLNANDFLRA